MRSEVAETPQVDDSVVEPPDATLYRHHVPAAIRLAFLLTGDAAIAQDLAHEAFLRCASKRASMRSPDRFGAYLRRAVVREVAMRRRAADREYGRLDRASRSRPVTDDVQTATDRVDLVAALQRLPARQRTAIVLRYWSDLPEAEIARSLGCRPGTVKSSLARGLAALRLEVEDRG
jgi:RNA polymerase sigma-70 factor (sigma-E family)